MQVSDAVPKGPLVDLSPIILMECPKHIDAISMIVHSHRLKFINYGVSLYPG